MYHEVDIDLRRLGHINVEECEPCVIQEVLDVRERAGHEVIDADDLMAIADEAPAEMTADEPGAAGDEDVHWSVARRRGSRETRPTPR